MQADVVDTFFGPQDLRNRTSSFYVRRRAALSGERARSAAGGEQREPAVRCSVEFDALVIIR
jgi:hypothetical protein